MSDREKRRLNVPVVAIVCAALGVMALAISLIVIASTNASPTKVMYWSLCVYIAVLALFAIAGIVHKRMKTGDFTEIKGSIFGTISLDFIQKLYMPVLICDDKGKIVWYNSARSATFRSKGVLYGKYIDSICNATIERIMGSEEKVEVS